MMCDLQTQPDNGVQSTSSNRRSCITSVDTTQGKLNLQNTILSDPCVAKDSEQQYLDYISMQKGVKIMNAVKVQYTVKEEYVETNKVNIQRVMADLKEINDRGYQIQCFSARRWQIVCTLRNAC